MSTIDVEKLIEPFDLDMDLSQLSVSDLYIVRHAFAARKGFPYRNAYLRGIYGTTTWYDSLTWVFDEDSLNFKNLPDKEATGWRDYYYDDIRELTYTNEEQAFNQQLFHVYEQNDYHLFPSFVTTDLYLQLYHLYFDATLREVEQSHLAPMLAQFCKQASHAVAAGLPRQAVPVGRDIIAATWLRTYFGVATALLTGQPPPRPRP